MLDIPVKTDGVSSLPAATFNAIVDELEKIITSTGIALDSGSTQQIAEAIAAYAAVGQYYSESGSANAYVCSLVPATRLATKQYFTGMIVNFVAANANTGASTINVAGLGSKNIKKYDGTTDLDSGDIKTTGLTKLWYDGTSFRLQSSGVSEAAANGTAGDIGVWAGTIASIPADRLHCDGSAVSRTTYADLFAAIGTQYGVGDGSTTFNLPDTRDFYMVGASQDDSGVAKSGANRDGTLAKTRSDNNTLGKANDTPSGGGGAAITDVKINDVAATSIASPAAFPSYPNYVAFAITIKF